MTDTGTVLKFSVLNGTECKSIFWVEDTGVYSASNPTGWGAPNPTTASATSAVLDITLQDGTVIPAINLFASGFPSSSFNEYEILNSVLGYSGEIPSQVVTMTYTVTDADTGWQEVTTKYVLIRCTLDCCKAKAAAAVDLCDCSCENEKLRKFLMISGFLDAAQAAVDCNEVDKAKSIVNHLNAVCTGCGCGCQ